jgi:hypothetical protein
MKIRLQPGGLDRGSLLNACGGGGGGDKAPTPTYTVGGTVSGLTGAGLVLELNGGSDLNVAADGSFNFRADSRRHRFHRDGLNQPAAQTCSAWAAAASRR